MRVNLLLILTTVILTSCSPSYKQLIEKKEYGAAFEKIHLQVLKNQNRAHKYKDKLLYSFNMSIEKDQIFVINSLNNQGQDYYKYHAILEGIDARDQKIKSIFSLPKLSPYRYAIRGYDTDDLKIRVAEAAYDYFDDKYKFWISEIYAGDKKNARNTWEMIQGMKFFAPMKHDYEQMYEELKQFGTIYTLMMTTNNSRYAYDPLRELMNFDLNEPLMVYDFDPNRYDYDRILEVFIEDIDPGSDYVNISSRNVSKEIQVGEKTEVVEIEVCQPCKNVTSTVTLGDSTFTKTKCIPQPPIKKKEYKKIPIYQTVCATIEEHCLVRNARAFLTIYLEDTKANQLIFKKEDVLNYNYSDRQTRYSGDSRALDCYVSSFVSLSSPSSIAMVNRLKGEIQHWTKAQLDYIRKF